MCGKRGEGDKENEHLEKGIKNRGNGKERRSVPNKEKRLSM